MSEPRPYTEKEVRGIARARGYAVSWRRQRGAWLVWQSSSERGGSAPFAEAFPQPKWLREGKRWERLHLHSRDLSSEMEGIKREYAYVDTLLERYRANPAGAMAELNAVVSASTEDLNRVLRRMQESVSVAESVLRVWYAETERVLLGDGGIGVLAALVEAEELRYRHNAMAGIRGLRMKARASEKSARRMRDSTIHQARRHGGAGILIDQARVLWSYVVYGVTGEDSPDALLRFYDHTSARLDTPLLVAASQRIGLGNQLNELVALRMEAREADKRRELYEAVRYECLTRVLPSSPVRGEGHDEQGAGEAIKLDIVARRLRTPVASGRGHEHSRTNAEVILEMYGLAVEIQGGSGRRAIEAIQTIYERQTGVEINRATVYDIRRKGANVG